MQPDEPKDLSRRRLLLAGAVASSIPVAGCIGLDDYDDDDDTNDPTPTPEPTTPPTETPAEVDIDPWDFAGDVTYWAWFPSDDTLWSRSSDPYDFRDGEGRWLAWPTEDGSIRCRVEGDDPPGNAGVYFDIGPIGDIANITVESETVESDSGNQQLLFAIYLDVSGEGDYFEWEAADEREAFVSLGDDVEGIGMTSTRGTFTIDDDTELDLIPPNEEKLVNFGAFKAGEVDGIEDSTEAALQVSVVGSGEGNVEEGVIHDVSIETVDPPQAGAEDWPMYRHDRFNTGRNNRTIGPTGPIEPAWIFDTDNQFRSSPAVVDNHVYVGSDDGHLYAIDRESGDQVWAFHTNGPIRSSPAFMHGIVYVGSDDGQVYAVNADTGQERWSITTGGKVRSSPAVSPDFDPHFDELVVIGSHDSYLYLIDAYEGSVHRRWRSEGPIVVKPLLRKHQHEHGSMDSFYYWGTLEGVFHNHRVPLDPAHPIVRATVGPIRSSLTWGDFGDRTLYVGDGDGLVHVAIAYREWMTYDTGAPIRTSPARDPRQGVVHIGNDAGTVYAVDLSLDRLEDRTDTAEELGDALWSFETDGPVRSSPILVGEVLYVGSDDGHVYGLNRIDGEERWRYETGGRIRSAPAVSKGTLYVGSDDGNLYALRDE